MVRNDSPESESDLRRRAAWLLAMLAIAAVLLVVVMSQLLGADDSGESGQSPGALDSAVGAKPSSSASRHPTTHAPRSRTRTTASTSVSSSSGPSAVHGVTCPTKETCVLEGDPGNGIAAVNDYRTQHGKEAVTGRVTAKAQQCAFRNGNGCTGGWAETEVGDLDGSAAVQKILPFAHLLSDMKNFEVGWAYDPRAKLYYFAIVRND